MNKILKEELDLIIRKVHSGTYRFTSYKEKLISKGAKGLPRVISIPTVRDRIVLRGICNLLALVFPQSKPDIPQVKIDALATALAMDDYQEFVKIDLRQFYPSIPHDKLLQALKQKIRKPPILSLIASAIETPTVPAHRGGKGSQKNIDGVPQGLAISNLLAEIFLQKFDEDMRKRQGIWYRRYVDDILILCPLNESKDIGDVVCDVLKSHGLDPHGLDEVGSKSKVGLLCDEFEFLGYHVANRKLSVRTSSIQKFESSLAEIFTDYRHKLAKASTPEHANRALRICEWRVNLRLTGCIFHGQRLGWVFYFSQITDTSRLRAVDNTVSKMMQRFQLHGKFTPRRSLKAYYECRRRDKSEHKYIPNFDNMSIDERRDFLLMFSGDPKLSKLSDKRINQLFEMRISAAVRELEKDLALMS